MRNRGLYFLRTRHMQYVARRATATCGGVAPPSTHVQQVHGVPSVRKSWVGAKSEFRIEPIHLDTRRYPKGGRSGPPPRPAKPGAKSSTCPMKIQNLPGPRGPDSGHPEPDLEGVSKPGPGSNIQNASELPTMNRAPRASLGKRGISRGLGRAPVGDGIGQGERVGRRTADGGPGTVNGGAAHAPVQACACSRAKAALAHVGRLSSSSTVASLFCRPLRQSSIGVTPSPSGAAGSAP